MVHPFARLPCHKIAQALAAGYSWSMPLFEFELARVEDITPWGEPGNRSLSWFALTDGTFRIAAGEQILFRYTPEVLAHWGMQQQDADYQIAAFARDMLGAVAAALTPLPALFERLVADWELLSRLQATSSQESSDVSAEDDYTAWSWLGERSPWTSYLNATPQLCFVRVGDEVHVRWDNRQWLVDGIPVWTAQHGVLAMPANEFLGECRSFADRLLDGMQSRINDIEANRARPQVPVDVFALREQQETWREEFETYFAPYKPDIPWGDAERAVRRIAQGLDLRLPVAGHSSE